MVDSTNPERWITRALMDLRGAKNNLNDDPAELSELICYESQQACEKALKAVLLHAGLEPPRTHDLLSLLSIAESMTPGLTIFRPAVSVLGRYSNIARYPNDMSDYCFTSEQAEAAYAMAIAIVEFIKEALSIA